MATKRELGETRTQRLERFALRGAYAEKELHETKQALAAMQQRAEQAEAKLAAVPWELIRTVARGALNFNFVPAVDIVKVLSWVDDNDAQQEAQP